MKHFYMIKKGTVKTYDEKFNYISNLEAGSFFGEYSILLGLTSFVHFQASINSNNSSYGQVLLFKIEKKKFVEIIVQEGAAYIDMVTTGI